MKFYIVKKYHKKFILQPFFFDKCMTIMLQVTKIIDFKFFTQRKFIFFFITNICYHINTCLVKKLNL